MKYRFATSLFIILAVFLSLSCDSAKKEITFLSLLHEMTDRESISKYPDPYYTAKQFSSYDRASDTARVGSFYWFANWDFSQFLRTEENNGRREFVLFDAEGPGAVVRFWITVAHYNDNGILRLYLDKSETPVIEGEVLSLISGGKLVGDPLSTSVSETTPYKQRGHNLYLPIPYSQHCKITYETPGIIEAGRKPPGENFFYSVAYRTYEEGTDIKSFTMEDLSLYSEDIKLTQQKLKSEPDFSNLTKTESETKNIKSKDSENMISLSGTKAIKGISVKLNAEDYEQALRSTILKISFDGNQSVWVPVGDFFATGNRLSPYRSFYTTVTKDSILDCYWVMPFKDKCEISLENLNGKPVQASLTVYLSDTKWNKNSMYFGAGWTEYNRKHTGEKRSIDGSYGARDINFVTLNGKGIYVGDAVTIFNPIGDWWGEGDEKVYVDGESFPSFFGTGTEDYYGYAWCLPNFFEHPFIGQPDGQGAYQPGHVSNLRYRGLDGITFDKSIIFDMEFWHQGGTYINYAVTTYWYMLPGGKTNRKEETALASLPIVKHKNELVSNVPDENGIIEGEYLNIKVQGGMERTQSLIDFEWRNGTQFIWCEANTGDIAWLGFVAKDEGVYQINFEMTTATDYGRFSLYINDKLVEPSFNAYSSVLQMKTFILKNIQLRKGENVLKVVQLQRDPKAVNTLFGLDYMTIIKK